MLISSPSDILKKLVLVLDHTLAPINKLYALNILGAFSEGSIKRYVLVLFIHVCCASGATNFPQSVNCDLKRRCIFRLLGRRKHAVASTEFLLEKLSQALEADMSGVKKNVGEPKWSIQHHGQTLFVANSEQAVAYRAIKLLRSLVYKSWDRLNCRGPDPDVLLKHTSVEGNLETEDLFVESGVHRGLLEVLARPAINAPTVVLAIQTLRDLASSSDFNLNAVCADGRFRMHIARLTDLIREVSQRKSDLNPEVVELRDTVIFTGGWLDKMYVMHNSPIVRSNSYRI